MFPSRPPNVLFSARQQNLNNIGGINHQRFHRQTNNPGDPTVVSNFVDTGSVYGQHHQQQQQQPPWRRVPFPSPEQVCIESILRFDCATIVRLCFSFQFSYDNTEGANANVFNTGARRTQQDQQQQLSSLLSNDNYNFQVWKSERHHNSKNL